MREYRITKFATRTDAGAFSSNYGAVQRVTAREARKADYFLDLIDAPRLDLDAKGFRHVGVRKLLCRGEWTLLVERVR